MTHKTQRSKVVIFKRELRTMLLWDSIFLKLSFTDILNSVGERTWSVQPDVAWLRPFCKTEMKTLSKLTVQGCIKLLLGSSTAVHGDVLAGYWCDWSWVHFSSTTGACRKPYERLRSEQFRFFWNGNICCTFPRLQSHYQTLSFIATLTL